MAPRVDIEHYVLTEKVFAGQGVPPQPGVVDCAWLWVGVGTKPPPAVTMGISLVCPLPFI